MKIGLVLAGGGGKGAYELGVWKALRDLGISKYISVFSGTSIGAFNAVLFAMDDIKKAEQLWDEVTMDKLVPVTKKELIKRGIGLYIGGKNIQLAKKFLNDKSLLKRGKLFKSNEKREILQTTKKPLNTRFIKTLKHFEIFPCII